MRSHKLKLYRSAAVGLVLGAPSKSTRWRRTRDQRFPPSNENGDVRAVDVIKVLQDERETAGLLKLDESDILDALEAAEEAIDLQNAEKAVARKKADADNLENAAA